MIKILSESGFQYFDNIIETIHTEWIKFHTESGKIEVSLNHKFKNENSVWVQSLDLNVGEKIKTKTGFEKIIRKEFHKGKKSFFDPVNVKNGNSYYSNDIVSHNCNEFLGTSNTLIAMNILNAMVHKNPIKIDNNGSIKIYKEVQEGNQYVITLDPSEGVGGDFHACSVIDISQLPYEQVATYRNNMDSPSGVVPEIIWKLSEYYNSALILVESNISAGHEIAKILHEELESENVLMTTMKGRKGQIISTGFGNSGLGYGVRMTKSVKKMGCSKLKDLIETGNFIVNDFDTKSELSKFVRVRDSFAADANESDDTVMSLVLFSWLTNQDFFKNINEKITRKLIYKEQLEAIEENLLPIGFFPDSHMDTEEEIWSEYQMLPY